MSQKLFIVSVDANATTVQKNAFTAFLRNDNKGLGFWHHTSNEWVIHDIEGQLTAVRLRDKISELMGSTECLVMQVRPLDWAVKAQKSAHQWLHTNINSKLWKDI